jgi:kynurenine 3-monooxygenase
MKKIAIVGAGLVGSLQAILMAKKGYQVQVLEHRPDRRKSEFIGGRSINLALSDRGWKALDLAGVSDKIREIALPMYRRCMHDLQGNLTYQPYGLDNEAIYSVSRGLLNKTLMNEAEHYPNIEYLFDLKCKDVDLRDNTLVMQNLNKEVETFKFDKLFACDGAFSAVRGRMQRTTGFNYQQSYLGHGYKELEIPANEDGTHKLENDCLHIWPRGEFMMIALPNIDGSFTLTLFMTIEGEVSFNSLNTNEKIMNFFLERFPDAVPLIPELLEDFNNNPVGNLMTVKCDPWQYNDDILLLGDAAHAIVPFYGQGMNAGFQDCTVFNEMYEERGGNWNNLMKDFSDQHHKNGHAIADLALYNYIEMRDKTADPDFLLRKKIEAKFTRLHPDLWLPLYSRVTFTQTPYAEAMAHGDRQRAIMDQIMEIPDIHNIWDDSLVIERIKELLDKDKTHA